MIRHVARCVWLTVRLRAKWVPAALRLQCLVWAMLLYVVWPTAGARLAARVGGGRP